MRDFNVVRRRLEEKMGSGETEKIIDGKGAEILYI
jgi:hypothetical protein